MCSVEAALRGSKIETKSFARVDADATVEESDRQAARLPHSVRLAKRHGLPLRQLFMPCSSCSWPSEPGAVFQFTQIPSGSGPISSPMRSRMSYKRLQ
jgi:hypothetical protein